MTANWKAPNASLILPANASRDDWLSTRRLGLGGSDIAEITGASRWKSPYAIWMDKTSDEPPVEEEKDIFWFGQEVEPLLAARFTADTGVATRNVGTYQSKTHPFILANPDRFTADGGVLEIKTTGGYTDKAKEWRSGEVPSNAYVQGQTYLAVTGRSHLWFIALVDRTPYIIGPVERDEKLIAEIMATGAEFWTYVESVTPPPIDMATATAGELTDRYPQVIDPEAAVEILDPDVEEAIGVLTEVKTLEADIKDRKADAEKKLKAAIGDKEFLTLDGRPVAKWSNVAGRRTFDADAVLRKIAADRGVEDTKKNLADIKAEYTKQGEPTRRFSLIQDAA